MSEHTPGPWRWVEEDILPDMNCDGGMRPISLKSGQAFVIKPHISRQRSVAFPWLWMTGEDKEFIARACNCHDDLLAALKEMREMWPGLDNSFPKQLRELLEKSEAAIAAAEGKS